MTRNQLCFDINDPETIACQIGLVNYAKDCSTSCGNYYTKVCPFCGTGSCSDSLTPGTFRCQCSNQPIIQNPFGDYLNTTAGSMTFELDKLTNKNQRADN